MRRAQCSRSCQTGGFRFSVDTITFEPPIDLTSLDGRVFFDREMTNVRANSYLLWRALVSSTDEWSAERPITSTRPPADTAGGDETIQATLKELKPVVRDLVRFQRLTGCRPGELFIMRPMDIHRAGDVWRYVPMEHKTEEYGHKRVIFIGPQSARRS